MTNRIDPQLQIIIDASPLGFVVFDGEARVIAANTLAEQLFERPAATLKGLQCSRLVACTSTDTQECNDGHSCPSCPLCRAVRTAIAGETGPHGQSGEASLQMEQSTIWVKYKVNGILLDGGNRVALLAIDDITDQRRDQNNLRNAMAELSAIHDNAPIAMLLLDQQQHLTNVNGFAARFADRSREAMVGMTCGEALRCLHYLDDPGGCGFGPACIGCQIRLAVLDTFSTCKSRQEVEAWLPLQKGEQEKRRCLLISTAYLEINAKERVLVCVQDITSRKEAEKALRKGEEKYRRFYENSLAGIFSSTPEGRFIEVNPAFAAMIGYNSAEDLVSSITDIATQYYVHPQDRRQYQDILEKKGYGESFEFEVKARDGSRVWVYNNSGAVLADDGSIDHYEGIVIDISERKRAETALRESEQRFRLFAELAPVGIAISDHQEKTVYLSKNFTSLFGYTLEDMPSVDHWWLLAYPDEQLRDRIRLQWQEILAEAKRTSSPAAPLEYPVTCKDGTIRHIEFRVTGTESLNFIVFLDVSDRRKAEEALRESEERFHKAFISSPAPLVISDIDSGRFFDVNDRWVQMLGFTREEQLGRTSIEVGIWADPAERQRIISILQEKGSFKEEPIEFTSKSGQSISALWSAEAVSLGGRQVMLSMIYDQSERRKGERERDKLQKQLIQAQKMESVGRLAGGVAHDYNNMLSVIIGYTENALEKIAPDNPLHEDLHEILKAARRSTEITQQLLAFARKQTIAPKIVDLNAIVASMLKMLRRLIGEDISLEWHPARQLWPVKIDPAQLDQILANLSVNARDAIGGVGRIVIEAANVTLDETFCEANPGSSPGQFLILSVSDNGCGMDKKTLENIFEPFFTTKGLTEGTGLGLATVYGIVKQNHGFITVTSEPGSGAAFKVFLPRHADGEVPVPVATKVQTPRGSGEKILLVEDEPAITLMAQMMLKKLGYEVLAASTPGQAIEIVGKYADEIDLLITDVVMPEMNGRDLADILHSRYKAIKTLFMSGYTADVIAERGVLGEDINFIQKPFTMHELGTKVRAILDTH